MRRVRTRIRASGGNPSRSISMSAPFLALTGSALPGDYDYHPMPTLAEPAGEVGQRICKPGSVHPMSGIGDHSSRTAIARGLKRPTRATGRSKPMRRPYSVLLPVGFTMPSPLPETRCALAAPFLPYPNPKGPSGGILSVALSLTPLARGRRALPGTVSPRSPDFPPVCQAHRRPPDPLAVPADRARSGRAQPPARRCSAPLSPPVSSDRRMARVSPSMTPSIFSGR